MALPSETLPRTARASTMPNELRHRVEQSTLLVCGVFSSIVEKQRLHVNEPFRPRQ
jgi:hypothetical protein